MSEKHKLVPAEQLPVAWARVKNSRVISVFHDKRVAEFLSGFAASELVPLYMRPQPAEQQPADAAPAVQLSDDHKALIREVFQRNGFTIKDGRDDLADYVYAAAHDLLQVAPKGQAEVVGWQFYQDGRWWNGDDRIKDHRKNTLVAGFRVRDVYVTQQPAEQPAPQTKMLDDDSLARQIGEIGNQIHNLGCEYRNDEELADRLAEIAHQAWMLQRSVMASKQQPAPDVEGLEMVDVAQDGQYPPCDFCGATPDHHPWHGSGMFKGVDSPHIHACNGCRHLLPSRAAPDVAQLVEALDGAARSLGTISRQAGIDEYMCDFLEVRGYARNRAMVAFEALAAHHKQGR